ncbi:nuclear transport factor 2 family protein [Solimonas marina]|uniref:Nuclear transport factor 2 family protein n=1 Tax=Solimonas marina TaxID=2714601 RepID=A0A969WBS9_9GAMM|nr:nuclear transport factor 2 family protein [Solimonas marina]NKF23639.1 nuclear transport factor 2 family protein [Solimonas marina]
MHPHAVLIETFYASFARRDAAAMGACYHADAHFSDPAFPDLDAAGVRAMWTMLCAAGKDLRVEYSAIDADDQHGRAHWDAHYTFSGTGRAVLNRIDAQFSFRDGLIVEHRDVFDFHRWATQALGLPGRLFGGTQWLQRKVQVQAATRLAAWRDHHPEQAGR